MGAFALKGMTDRGQATVEAAVAAPVVFVLILLLIQPGIVLYDRMVMASAAAEGCRMLATSEDGIEGVESFVRRRLGAIPEQDNFHVHASGCTWRVRCEGGGAADMARVTVTTEVRPLPLIGAGATLLGLVNENGNMVIEVTSSIVARPEWAQASLGGSSPNDKVGDW